MSTSVLAVGAWLKNAACLLVNGRAVWSPMHGDLSDPAACGALERSVQALLQQAESAGAPVQAIAHDLHPDFFSTRLALEQAAALGVPAIGVQHHLAHVAAVVAEHAPNEPVIGLALDGVGLGSDGGAWGGELIWLHGASWQRLGHLHELALPGGDRAAREPWRMAASVLHAMGRGAEITPRFTAQMGEFLASGVQQMLSQDLNCPRSSSAGRWFDAAAGALGLCLRQTDEAEAAVALETAAKRWLVQHPDTGPLPGALINEHHLLDLRGLMPALLDAPPHDVDAAAAGFHLALADALAIWAIQAANARGCHVVALCGGCFFNSILRERLRMRLQEAGLQGLMSIDKGCGDAGLALGQAWVATQELTPPLAHLPISFSKEPEPCV